MTKGWLFVKAVMFGQLILNAAAFTLAAPPSGAATIHGKISPAYTVILRDGTRIPAKAKPISAFGKFRYVDSSGRTVVISPSSVDLKRTRQANSQVPTDRRAGTFSIGGGVTNSTTEEADEDGSDSTSAIAQPASTVVVYSATWCQPCKKLKQFLAEKSIPASITEVDQLPKAEQESVKAEMKRLTGRVAYPTVVIDGRAKAGFSPTWILKALGR